MNEKVKTRLYLLIGILGIAFALAVKLILQRWIMSHKKNMIR